MRIRGKGLSVNVKFFAATAPVYKGDRFQDQNNILLAPEGGVE